MMITLNPGIFYIIKPLIIFPNFIVVIDLFKTLILGVYILLQNNPDYFRVACSIPTEHCY